MKYRIGVGIDTTRRSRWLRLYRNIKRDGDGVDKQSRIKEIDDAERRLRRAKFRAWHRGTKEMDLLLGRFVDERIATLSDSELSSFERLLEESDPDLFSAITHRETDKIEKLTADYGVRAMLCEIHKFYHGPR